MINQEELKEAREDINNRCEWHGRETTTCRHLKDSTIDTVLKALKEAEEYSRVKPEIDNLTTIRDIRIELLSCGNATKKALRNLDIAAANATTRIAEIMGEKG